MKIFYIYTALTTKGGADRIISNKANYLSEHGYDISIVTDSQNGREPSFPLYEKVKLIDLNIDFGKEYGHNFAYRTFMYFILMRKYKKAIKELIFSEKPDIIITTLGRDLDFITSIKDGSIKIGEAHTNKKYLRNFHLLEQRGFPFNFIARYWKHKMEKNVSKLNAIVLLTKEDENYWKGLTKTFVINNFVPFYPKSASTCINKQAIIVGRYNNAKGYKYLIEAWNLVKERHPDWVINIYGSGEYYDIVKKEIHDRNLENVMIMNEPTDEIITKYLNSSIYVMSSRYEGFGMVLLEAMACGVPCVAFDCPHGPRNIIKNGEDGILVKYLDSKALADGICLLIENENLRNEMGSKARINIQRFSKESIMNQWIQLFNLLSEDAYECN
ncbi:glycosyltransferase family 4 protein [Xylanibacter oryzae]|uniref:glycosyltransferase family 4 protein n=1 Tax=Xylanibacter oryzae TaxID=185293 RepID=UPI0004AE5933|nr:glycosyltransferase family 4 protein [Xylanibacter oryzae]